MKNKDHNWELAGSLTPELDGTPHSGAHKRREAFDGKLPVYPKNVDAPTVPSRWGCYFPNRNAQRLAARPHCADLNTTL
jgi:hypothetical protein